MWRVLESASASKVLRRAPQEIREKYDVWQNIVRLSGPPGLRAIKGFQDEALKGKWRGFRSSRLNLRYRVIYRVVDDEVAVYVIDVAAHDYRRH